MKRTLVLLLLAAGMVVLSSCKSEPEESNEIIDDVLTDTNSTTTDTELENTDLENTDVENTDAENTDAENTDVEPPTGNEPGGEWERHVINDEIGGAIQMKFVPNLCGDGALKAIGSNHANARDEPNGPESQIVLFDVPKDPTALRQPWPMRKISEGIVSRRSPLTSPQAAPGIFGWGDGDMDGDIDLLVSGDGDANIYVLEQTSPCVFKTRILATKMGQAGVMIIDDLDKDGINELIVSSYEANIVKAYEWNYPDTVNYDDYGSNFEQHIILEHKAPAFATLGDINEDGHLDLLISHYAPMSRLSMLGELALVLGTGDLDNWNVSVIDNKVRFPHVSTLMDVDGDGDMDIFHPSGFLACEVNPMAGGACGSIAWYENDGDTWAKHRILGPKNLLFFWHGVFDDYDDDGLLDFITVGERKVAGGKQEAHVFLFKGTKSDPYFSQEPIELGEGLGTIPEGRDIDDDGDLDLFSAEFFLDTKKFAKFSFAWFEQIAPPSAE